MFEFPELFGSSYTLPGLIAVVVLLLIVLLLVIRRRRKASPKEVGPATAAPKSRVKTSSEPVSPTEPPAPVRSPSVGVPVSSGLGARLPTGLAALPTVDPLRDTLDSMLRGWGDLTDEDLARLRIFKPERVIAAISSLELPPDLKKSQFAPLRLDRLRAYAAALAAAKVNRAGEPQQAPQDSQAATPTSGETATPTSGETATASSAGAAAFTSGEPPIQQGPAQLSDSSEPVSAEPKAQEQLSESAGPKDFDVNQPAPPEQEPQVEAPVPEVPEAEAVVYEETPVEEVKEFLEIEELPLEEEIAEVVEPVVEEPAQQEPTAESVLALPSSEQRKALALLDPKELARVFEMSTDIQLRKAVIDVLEQIGSPAHLELLQRCLDDPDPEIQLYALAAADRILGSER
ncbi:MAG: hypothetical protein N3B14_09460 [Thermoleophilia bacterium]|nr:hypothetical protein [Thermoleophilia bacterium]